MVEASLLRDLGFALATILIIIGTALLYRNEGNIVKDTPETRSKYNWDVVVFFLVLVAAIAARYLGKPVFAVFAAGMLVSLAIYRTGNYASWTYVNYCRVQEGSSATSSKSTQYCTGGGVLAYAGVFLASALAFVAKGSLAGTTTKFTTLLGVLAAVFAIIGVIVLWTSDASTVKSDAYSLTADTTVFTILATVYSLVGAFFGSELLRSSAAFISSAVFVTVFHDMFSSANTVGATENRQVYAGYFFCWLAMITNMVLAIHLFWNVGPAKIGPQ